MGLKYAVYRVLVLLRAIPEYIRHQRSFKPTYAQIRVTGHMKNILCLGWHMSPGGAEKVILDIARSSDRTQFSFHMVTTAPSRNSWIEKYKLYFQNVIAAESFKTQYLHNLIFSQLIRKLNIDIVIVYSPAGYAFLPHLKKKFPQVKTLDLLHSEWSLGSDREYDRAIPYLDARVCVNRHLKGHMEARYRKQSLPEAYYKNLKIIYNGVDIDEFNPAALIKGKFKKVRGIAEDTLIISFIGRFSPEKNPLGFVEIARRLLARSPDYRLKFVMAGDGQEFEKVKSAISKYGLDSSFLLTGTIDAVSELLSDTYLLLLVSEIEGIPLVALEAMSMQVPVISTDVGGVKEIIQDGENGFLIRHDDAMIEAFVSKIREILSGKEDYARLASRARQTVIAEFSLQKMGLEYRRLFDELSGSE